MKIKSVEIKNFRLLSKAKLDFEDVVTVIVGRNNSGKTSLAEVLRRFLGDSSPKFQLEDFSSTSYDCFIEAKHCCGKGFDEEKTRLAMPCIELRINIEYSISDASLGILSEFIIELDPTCLTTTIVIRYELEGGSINKFFKDADCGEEDEDITSFFRKIRENIPKLYTINSFVEDPNDVTNVKFVPLSAVRSLISTEFVNAQRGLDDNTTRNTDVLAKILEGLFMTAKSSFADAEDKEIVDTLVATVQGVQQMIDKSFNAKLKGLMPTLNDFGYPGLDGQRIETETILDVERLLSNHTKVRYAGSYGVHLPESYNGLGVRNLIFILLQLVRFHKEYKSSDDSAQLTLVFIEEPEAHLHPQMQEVFIRQLYNLVQALKIKDEIDIAWPVQFVVSTHSSHIANEAGFESIRYFHTKSSPYSDGDRMTFIKDLNKGLAAVSRENRRFLQQYLTLTRCDLFFADKVILVEGTCERLLMPVIIKKIEEDNPGLEKISSQYVTILEVGGAYSHLFFDLVDYLELSCLVVTDIDTIDRGTSKSCTVHSGNGISNASIKKWFGKNDISPAELLVFDPSKKIFNNRRIAYQVPETAGGPCGRTFEDSLMLSNTSKFGIEGVNQIDIENSARELVEKIKKSDFALKLALNDLAWEPPLYIKEGLIWLASYCKKC